MASDVKVGDVMATPPVTIGPERPVYEAARVMKEKRIGGLIVVDSDGSLIGVLTVRDIVYRVVAEGLSPDKVLVRDVMTTDPFYVFEDDSIEKAAEIMVANNIGHLPVLNPETFRVVGVISKRDIVKVAPDLLASLMVRGVL